MDVVPLQRLYKRFGRKGQLLRHKSGALLEFSLEGELLDALVVKTSKNLPVVFLVTLGVGGQQPGVNTLHAVGEGVCRILLCKRLCLMRQTRP